MARAPRHVEPPLRALVQGDRGGERAAGRTGAVAVAGAAPGGDLLGDRLHQALGHRLRGGQRAALALQHRFERLGGAQQAGAQLGRGSLQQRGVGLHVGGAGAVLAGQLGHRGQAGGGVLRAVLLEGSRLLGQQLGEALGQPHHGLQASECRVAHWTAALAGAFIA